MKMDAVMAEVRSVVAQDAEKQIVTCAQAFAIARKTGANLADVGAACNKLGVKIRSCQLGCF